MRTTRLRGLIAAFPLSLALAACGGDTRLSGERSGATTTAAEPAATAPTGGGVGRGASGTAEQKAKASATGVTTAPKDASAPEETVRDYLRALAAGDERGCRLFTAKGRAQFETLGSGITRCEKFFELARRVDKGTVDVGGRDLRPNQLDQIEFEVERDPGAKVALVAGPGALARLKLVDGRWLIDSIEETG